MSTWGVCNRSICGPAEAGCIDYHLECAYLFSLWHMNNFHRTKWSDSEATFSLESLDQRSLRWIGKIGGHSEPASQKVRDVLTAHHRVEYE